MSKTIGNGKYVLTQRLGSGSFAQVYLATKAESGETFAIKAIARNKLVDVKIQENLDSEIMIMRDYIHPNIVRLFEHYVRNSKLLFKKLICYRLQRITSIWC